MSRFKKKKFGSPVANRHIAEITGQRYHHRPYAWVRDDKAYTHITGGIVLPTFDQPGFLLTIGVRHNDQKYDCIEEFESWNDYELQNKAREIQKEYGQGVIQNWWGDPLKLMTLVNQENIKSDDHVLISAPADFEQKDSFQIYIISWQTALLKGSKVLSTNSCSILKNYLKAFVPDGAKEYDNPAVSLVGSLVHTLNIYRPWEQSVDSVELIPTSPEDFQLYESEKALKELEEEIWG